MRLFPSVRFQIGNAVFVGGRDFSAGEAACNIDGFSAVIHQAGLVVAMMRMAAVFVGGSHRSSVIDEPEQVAEFMFGDSSFEREA